jgi:hypothetical protein
MQPALRVFRSGELKRLRLRNFAKELVAAPGSEHTWHSPESVGAHLLAKQSLTWSSALTPAFKLYLQLGTTTMTESAVYPISHSAEPVYKECRLVSPGREDRLVSFSLLPVEARLFQILLATARSAGKSTTVRVAGGWVRDKLLHKCKDPDIDVALDNVTGREFAESVTSYLKSLGEKTSTVAIIQANPEQSKHLETATTKVLDLWVDFVNLRSEEYNSASRIPVTKFGTPLQDAERRDFTMNALFFNVTDDCIEDLLGQVRVHARVTLQ